MFERLQAGLSNALRTLVGQGRLTEANMREGLQLVQQALLDADVSLPVVKAFVEKVAAEAKGERVVRALRPTHQLLAIVYEQLVALMGPVDHEIKIKPSGSVLMLCGLQGSGKTTTCAKLARMLRERGASPLLVAADLQRPAAIEQLQILGERLGVPVYVESGATDPVELCRRAVAQAPKQGANVVILDTAGRLHVDTDLMRQLQAIDRKVGPDQVFLVVDSMTGQDAVRSAQAFHEALTLNGVILTKLDGDARGGAALSVRFVTGVPIKFIGTGEQVDALEEFHPERIAGRILGQGDLMSLIDQARRKIDQEAMIEQQKRIMAGEFTLDDFRNLLDQTSRLGPIQNVLAMLPGMSGILGALDSDDVDAAASIRRIRGIIDSMTPEERRHPDVIDISRRRRIAAGAGVPPHEVSELTRIYEPVADMMRKMASLNARGRLQMIQQLSRQMMTSPESLLSRQKKGTGKRLGAAEKAALRKQRERELRRLKREKKKNK